MKKIINSMLLSGLTVAFAADANSTIDKVGDDTKKTLEKTKKDTKKTTKDAKRSMHNAEHDKEHKIDKNASK